MRTRLIVGILIGSLLVAPSFGEDPVTIEGEAVFDGITYGSPYAIRLTNKTGDLSGVLSVISNGQSLNYPVELPRGSTKRIVTYPDQAFGAFKYTFTANRVRQEIEVSPAASTINGRGRFLVISDVKGSAIFIRGESATSRAGQIQDGYCLPADAPERGSAYSPIHGVMLGDGAERLTNQAVSALKQYVVTGGTLIFTGGASSPALSDPRWSDFLPITRIARRNLPPSREWQTFSGATLDGPCTIAVGKPYPGAKVKATIQGIPLAVVRSIGFGHVSYLAINPTEPPFTRWDGRAALVNRIWSLTDSVAGHNVLLQFASGTDYGTASSRMTATPYVYGKSGPTPVSPDAGNPFSYQLPKTNQIFSILGLYFICVVPLNFLILRKLKRGELAWITAPLISLIFAGVLFRSAQDLYGFQTSTASNGIVLFHDDVADGLFYGRSQFFIARSGVYDLKLSNVEKVGRSFNDGDYYASRSTATADLDVFDTGDELKVPNFTASNLAYRQLTITEKVPNRNRLTVRSTKLPNGKYRITIQNRTPLHYTGITVKSAGNIVGVPAMDPGALQTVDIGMRAPNAPDPKLNAMQKSNDLSGLLTRTEQVIVQANVSGYRPGPQIGKNVDQFTSLTYIHFLDLNKESGS